MHALSGFVRVLPSDELAALEGLESEIRRVQVGGRTVLVGRLGSGAVVAFGALCPHEMTDLSQATFVDGQVRCPRHNYLYDPHSGANVIPTDVARPENLWKLRPGYLPTYRAEELDGWVWVSKRPNAAPAGWDPSLQERPAVGDVPMTAPEPPAQAAAATVEHPEEGLRVSVGGELEVRLPTEPMPACTWTVEVPAATLAVVSHPTPPDYAVRLRAHGAGEGTVCCRYGRPWEAQPVEIRTYVVLVTPAS